MNAVTSVTGLCLMLVHSVYCVSQSTSVPACCALKLMDSTQQVAIETDRVLPVGQFRAASVRVCATDAVLIQLWTQLNSTSFQLKWQKSFTPTSTQTYQTFVTVVFDSSNMPTVTSSDRLGLYGVMTSSGAQKLDIPYEVDESHGTIHYTESRYTDTSVFAIGLQTSIEDLRWPRTFASYIRFCAQADCSDISADPLPVGTTQRTWYSSPASLPFCGCPTSCSPDVTLSDSISAQDSNIKVLEDQIKKMSDLIDSMSSSNVQTGFCPDNSVPGAYGVGSCYIIYRENVQLGEAAIRCSTEHAANLLDIESDVEERFIQNIVTSTANATGNGMETFWTAGMFNLQTKQWMWYRQDMTPRVTIAANSYRGWMNNDEPTPTSDIDTCLVLTVDNTKEDSYWVKNICFLQNYFICEIPKQCY
jgi:hypothetical protein